MKDRLSALLTVKSLVTVTLTGSLPRLRCSGVCLGFLTVFTVVISFISEHSMKGQCSMKICLDRPWDRPDQSPAVRLRGDRMFTLQRLLQELEASDGLHARRAAGRPAALYPRAGGEGLRSVPQPAQQRSEAGYAKAWTIPSSFIRSAGRGIGLAAELAECIHKTMGTLQPAHLEQHTAPNYGVIRFTAAFGVTGMILEHSFHTNTRMTTWLLDDENLKRLAAAAVLAEHYGLKKTADEPQRAETVCYHLLSDVPQGDYRTVLDKLIAADILRGRSGTGEERVLDLTEDSVRLLVLLDRAGAFGS